MKTFTFSLLIFICWSPQAQNISVGPSFGFHIRNNVGINTVSDSLTVQSDGSRSMQNVYEIFLENRIAKNWELRNTISLTDQLIGFTVFNSKASCQFCDVQKVTIIGSKNLGFENLLSYKLPFTLPVTFHLLGGLRTNFNFTKEHPDVFFREGSRHQGISEVINHLDETIKPVYFSYSLGIKCSWKNLMLIAQADRSMGTSITRDIEVYGKKYRFLNRTNTYSLTLGYNLMPLAHKLLHE